jgi:hypothetical protein
MKISTDAITFAFSSESTPDRNPEFNIVAQQIKPVPVVHKLALAKKAPWF